MYWQKIMMQYDVIKDDGDHEIRVDKGTFEAIVREALKEMSDHIHLSSYRANEVVLKKAIKLTMEEPK